MQVNWTLISTHQFVEQVGIIPHPFQVQGAASDPHSLLFIGQKAWHKFGNFAGEFEVLFDNPVRSSD